MTYSKEEQLDRLERDEHSSQRKTRWHHSWKGGDENMPILFPHVCGSKPRAANLRKSINRRSIKKGGLYWRAISMELVTGNCQIGRNHGGGGKSFRLPPEQAGWDTANIRMRCSMTKVELDGHCERRPKTVSCEKGEKRAANLTRF